jgi:outer membrane protein assembly factor BamB
MNKRSLLFLLILPGALAACSSMPSWMGGKEDEKPKLEGERKTALEIDTQLKVDDALKNSKPVLPPINANADWAQHSGVMGAASGNLAGGSFDKKSSATAGNGNDFSHTLVPRPVVAGGMVFVMDAAGVISAHDVANIENVKWKSNIVADKDEHDVIGGGFAFDSGVLYAISGQGQVAAINAASGKEIWHKDFSVPLRGSPRVSGDRVIITTIDSQAYALSAKNGDVLWDHRGINETATVMNSVSPTIAGDYALVPYPSGELFALSLRDGKELWSDTLLQIKNPSSVTFTGIGGDPVVDGQVVFATSTNGITTAIDIASGKRLWQQQAASLNTPWLAGDELFLLTIDNTLIDMVKYTGKIRWAASLPSYEDQEKKQHPISWYGPVLVSGKLLVTGSNGKMLEVSPVNGKILETKSIPGNVFTAPIIAGGRLYMVGQDATLYSFQ